MESNKILIGVQFIYNGETNEKSCNCIDEFIVPRDATLKQLLEGIKYGLRKKLNEYIEAGETSSEEYRRNYLCLLCYRECMKDFTDDFYPKITITSFDSSVDLKGMDLGRVKISEKDLYKKLYKLGFISSTRLVFDHEEKYQSISVNDTDYRTVKAFKAKESEDNKKSEHITFPQFNISSRQFYKFEDEPVEIIPPEQIPQKPKNSILTSILPTFIMAGTMILMRSFMHGGGGASMSFMYIGMAVAGLASSFTIFFFQKREYKKNLEKWRENYQNYLDSVCADIEIRQKNDRDKLNDIYPKISTIIESINKKNFYPIINDRVYSRVANDEDFLSIRLGHSDYVKSMFKINGTKKDEVLSPETFDIKEELEGASKRTKIYIHLPDDSDYPRNINRNSYLSNVTYALAKRYEYLKEAALMFSLKESGCLGIVANDKTLAENFVAKILFDVCYYQSPEDVQVVILFNQTSNYKKIEEKIGPYKFLPHFRELFNDKSQFVFNRKSANMIFGNTLNILSERENTENARPHIIFVVYDEYFLKEHALASYLPKVPDKQDKEKKNLLGISFIFVKKYKEYLPSYCTDIVELSNTYSSIVPRENEQDKKIFYWWKDWSESCDHEVLNYAYNAYKLLSSLSYSRISQNGKVPSSISFFELCGIKANENGEVITNIKNDWGFRKRKADNKQERIYDITKSLGVPIGATELGDTYLDLHENGDGPHMLVAGTTGSGKSETIISYLLSLCMHFTPEELSLMLVDMKGGGFIKRIGDLPHVVGTVTDVDGDESGTSDEYMVKRFLDSLKCEIKRRKLLLNKMHVDSVDKYIIACRDIESHIKELSNMSPQKNGDDKYEIPDADNIRKLAENEKLSHLVLVVDEFTELKRFTGESDDVDFIGEITTIARVGRSLGFHIILVSQNIEGAITDDIRVNSRARLCLKVATKQASKEMIGNDLAASPTMPGHGRAYLLVGTGSKFVYFQSAYTGNGINNNTGIPFEIIQAEKTGQYRKFYNSAKDNLKIQKEQQELKEKGKVITQCSAMVNEIKKTFDSDFSYIKRHIIFQPPLPSKVTLKNGKRYDIK